MTVQLNSNNIPCRPGDLDAVAGISVYMYLSGNYQIVFLLTVTYTPMLNLGLGWSE